MQRLLKKVYILGMVFLLCACNNTPTLISGNMAVDDSSEDDKEFDSYSTVVNHNFDSNTNFDTASEDDIIAVYVCGAVNEPGVYYMTKGSIKQDALVCAGGFAEGAAESYVNLAEQIEPGEQIYFPFLDELDVSYSPVTDKEKEGKININKASVDVLMTLPGIGENKALAIVEYRETYGAFESVEDIMNIPGIKEGIYSKIKDRITVK